jgi:hypothetical protein
VQTDARRLPDGSVTTEQRVVLHAPAVPVDEPGALALDRAYGTEVEGLLHGLVRVREHDAGIDIRLTTGGPALIRLGPRRVTIGRERVTCRYPIVGGLLARRPAGALTLEQVGGPTVELRSSVAGFHPRLAARPGFPPWTGVLYPRVQARLHDTVGRRFLARLAGGAPS